MKTLIALLITAIASHAAEVRVESIPVWNHAAAYAEPGGNFIILR